MLIINCHLISPDIDMHSCAICIEGSKIKSIYSAGSTLPNDEHIIDAKGQMVMPGFIDVHCHGKVGFDFTDGTQEAMDTFGKSKLTEGVTTLLPTTLTLPEETLAKAMHTAAMYVKNNTKGSKLAGVHLEGPFINCKLCGAQNPDFVRAPNIDEVKRLHSIFPVSKVSFAPEVDGGIEFSRQLRELGITPSCVHSAATFAEFSEAYTNGLRDLSHFCNQMTALHHRDIGLVGAGFMHKDVYLEAICDCLHLSPDMVKLIFKLKSIDRIQLITDAMCAAGLKDGDYQIGGLPVIVKGGAARLKSNDALAGSTLELNQALKNVQEITNLPLKELVKTTSWNQACSLGLDKLGKLEAGFYADIVILDYNFEIVSTIVDGELRYSQNGFT